jgi:putative endonuclease
MCYVYILKNNAGVYYKGFTENPEQRLEEHNEGKSTYTKNKGPWEMVYLITFESKREALIFEKKLKRQTATYLSWLIQQQNNLMKK